MTAFGRFCGKLLMSRSVILRSLRRGGLILALILRGRSNLTGGVFHAEKTAILRTTQFFYLAKTFNETWQK